MYNAGGHQYFIAVDPATSTTDAQFIINNAQTTPLVKFDINGSKFYYPLIANTITTLDASGNPSMILNQNTITFNLPITCTSTITATNLYSKTDADAKYQTISSMSNYYTKTDADAVRM